MGKGNCEVGKEEDGEMVGGNVPAVAELVADVLEVRVAHVVDAKDPTVRVLGHALTDVGEQLLLLLPRLLGHLREVERPRAFGLGHCGGW